jgi:hypothetical protein
MLQLVRLALLALAMAGLASAADPIIGTWKLNLKLSKYNPGPAPRSQVRVYEQTSDGIRTMVTTVSARGATTKSEYPANVDGKEYPVVGQAEVDAFRMTRVDQYTAEARLLHAGRTLATVLRVLAADGKTMTIAYQGRAQDGEIVQYTAVFDKQ